jgi:predicted lipoprotein with Yx(FWY)xxD motif
MCIIESNFGNRGNFEAVLREGNKLRHYWRNNNDHGLPWYQSVTIASNIKSNPAMIQSNFGNMGNFELVVREGSKLRHYWRNNDDSSYPWHKGKLFGDKVNSTPAMIQSNFGNMGNFELVVREGNKLRQYWRNNDASGRPWNTGKLFGDKVNSAPAMIQSNFGNMGNFELVVREGSKLRHYWRNNNDPSYPWHKGKLFGDKVNSAPAMIQSTFGNMGNFELLVREGDRLRHYWRNNDASGRPWYKGGLFSDHIASVPFFIQSHFGNPGNFELVVKRGSCWVHIWRNNNIPGFPWSEERQTHAVVPLGVMPSAAKKEQFLGYFPYLRNWHITAPATGTYNCISWSVGITDQWLWPGSSVAAFDAFYASYGWSSSSNGNREHQKRKIALWAENSSCTHGSRETYDCNWHESKCGSLDRIMHDRFQMQGGSYGKIIKYYEKYDPNANLDLA